jgi:hypothetical protein
MNRAEKEAFRGVIKGFENHYRQVQQEDGLHEDGLTENWAIRAAFYQACLRVVQDGNPFKSPNVQEALIHYYTKLRDDAYEHIVSRLE